MRFLKVKKKKKRDKLGTIPAMNACRGDRKGTSSTNS
jgi:hypothetical protein